jgi:hypothetical protein
MRLLTLLARFEFDGWIHKLYSEGLWVCPISSGCPLLNFAQTKERLTLFPSDKLKWPVAPGKGMVPKVGSRVLSW